VTGQNSEQVPSPIAGATRLKVLLRSVEEIDRELDEIAVGVPAARRDVALDLSSIARVDDVLSSLHDIAVRDDFVWSAPPPPIEAAPAASVEPPRTPQQEDQEAFATISFSDVPVALEEDFPRQLLDFEPQVAQADALATIVDMPDIVVDDAPLPLPSAVDTVIVAPDDAPPLGALSDLPTVNEPLFLSEPPAMPVGDLEFEAAPEVRFDDFGDGAAPDLGAAVESMLIDEDAVVVEGGGEVASPPLITAERSAPEAPEEQVVVDSDEVLVLDAPTAVTGTLLGLAPTFRPRSLTPSKPPENDLGEIVFNLEPELEVAKASGPLGAPASRPLLAPSTPLRVRDSGIGSFGAKRSPPKPSDSLDNLELDLADFMAADARPPSLRPPPLLRQPPPTPLSQRSAPPPVPRASKPRVESEEIVELDDQELEVMRASSRPPPGADSKAPPPVPQRPGDQK